MSEQRHLWTRIFYGIVAFYVVFTFIFYAAYPIVGDDWWFSVDYRTFYPYVIRRGWQPGRNISEFLAIAFGQGLGAPLGVLFKDTILGIRVANALGSSVFMALFWLVSSLFFPKKNQKLGMLYLIFLSFFLPTVAYTGNYMTLMVLGGFLFALLCFYMVYKIMETDTLPFGLQKLSMTAWGCWLVLCYFGTQIVDTGYFVVGSLFTMLLFYAGLQGYFPKLTDNPKPKYSKEIIIASFTYLAHCAFALARNFILGGRAHSKALTVISFDPGVLYSRLTAYHVMIDVSIVLAAVVTSWIIVKLLRKELEPQEQLSLAMLASGLAVILICCILGTYFDQAIWIIWIGLLRLAFSRWKEGCKITPLIMPTIGLWLFVGTFVITQPKHAAIRSQRDYRAVELFQKADRDGKAEISLSKEELSLLGISVYSWGLYPNIPSSLYRLGLISKPIEIVVAEAKASE